MMTVDQLRDWLRTLKGGDHVGVDEGGLILVVVEHPEVYWEIGGLPEDEGEDRRRRGLLGRTNARAARRAGRR